MEALKSPKTMVSGPVHVVNVSWNLSSDPRPRYGGYVVIMMMFLSAVISWRAQVRVLSSLRGVFVLVKFSLPQDSHSTHSSGS